jgi:hypothetical protein
MRSIAHQTFTPEEEFEIAERIRQEISIPGTLFTDGDFRAIAMEEYLARYWSEDEDWRAFLPGFQWVHRRVQKAESILLPACALQAKTGC